MSDQAKILTADAIEVFVASLRQRSVPCVGYLAHLFLKRGKDLQTKVRQ